MNKKHFLILSLAFLIIAIAPIAGLRSEVNLPSIVKKIQPSVVVILTYGDTGAALAQGSGFFINKRGDIVTNYHVLKGASRAMIKTMSGNKYDVKAIILTEEVDQTDDIIRISTDAPDTEIVPLEMTKILPEVGEKVVVIGSPEGLEQTVTDGIVSAVRNIPAYGNIIQISAPISPGSSGSPVVNMKGQVLGIASLYMLEGQNLNFAIPTEKILNTLSSESIPFTEWVRNKAAQANAESEYLYKQGLSYEWAGDYEKALSYFKKALEHNSNYADAYFQIGYCNGELGRWAEAMGGYKQAIRIKPDFAPAHNGLGSEYLRLARYTDAIEEYKQAIRIKPDYAIAHYGMGLSYLFNGDKGSALDEYKILRDLDKDMANELFNSIYK